MVKLIREGRKKFRCSSKANLSGMIDAKIKFPGQNCTKMILKTRKMDIFEIRINKTENYLVTMWQARYQSNKDSLSYPESPTVTHSYLKLPKAA